MKFKNLAFDIIVGALAAIPVVMATNIVVHSIFMKVLIFASLVLYVSIGAGVRMFVKIAENATAMNKLQQAWSLTDENYNEVLTAYQESFTTRLAVVPKGVPFFVWFSKIYLVPSDKKGWDKIQYPGINDATKNMTVFFFIVAMLYQYWMAEVLIALPPKFVGFGWMYFIVLVIVAFIGWFSLLFVPLQLKSVRYFVNDYWPTVNDKDVARETAIQTYFDNVRVKVNQKSDRATKLKIVLRAMQAAELRIIENKA